MAEIKINSEMADTAALQSGGQVCSVCTKRPGVDRGPSDDGITVWICVECWDSLSAAFGGLRDSGHLVKVDEPRVPVVASLRDAYRAEAYLRSYVGMKNWPRLAEIADVLAALRLVADRHKQALENVEWVSDGVIERCPSCGLSEHNGHDDECLTFQALSLLVDGPEDEKLKTDICDICGRERPAKAISLFGEIKYCNDNHNDLNCHERLNEKVGLDV